MNLQIIYRIFLRWFGLLRYVFWDSLYCQMWRRVLVNNSTRSSLKFWVGDSYSFLATHCLECLGNTTLNHSVPIKKKKKIIFVLKYYITIIDILYSKLTSVGSGLLSINILIVVKHCHLGMCKHWCVMEVYFLGGSISGAVNGTLQAYLIKNKIIQCSEMFLLCTWTYIIHM